nr:hypothetical protein CFP56_22956 [Quercus suber]
MKFCGDLDSESLRRSLQGNLGEEEEEDENDVAPLSSNEKSITIAPPTSPTFPSLPPSGDDDDADFSSLRLCSGGFAVRALVDPPAIGEKKAEDLADKILIKLEVKDFTEPVKKGTSWLRQLKMQHLVRRVVIMLALEAQLLDYDSNGNTTVKSSILHGVTVYV